MTKRWRTMWPWSPGMPATTMNAAGGIRGENAVECWRQSGHPAIRQIETAVCVPTAHGGRQSMDRLVGGLIPPAVQAVWGLSADDTASPLNRGGNRSVRVGTT